MPVEKKLERNTTFDKGQASSKNLKELIFLEPTFKSESKKKPHIRKKKVFTNFIKTQGFRGTLVKM